MPCPHCAASAIAEQRRRTARGDRTVRCRACRRVCNERTGTPYNRLQYPTDVVLLVVLWRLRYKLSLRDLAEMFLERGFVFTHETVRDRAARFAPLLTARLRAKRRGQGGAKGQADETYVRVDGRWRYRYRASDREGDRVDALRSERRAMDAARPTSGGVISDATCSQHPTYVTERRQDPPVSFTIPSLRWSAACRGSGRWKRRSRRI